MALTVTSANIEGLTAAKSSILSHMCKRECCHCLCLQETHRSTNLPRPKIAGMLLVVERPHNKYGSAILIQNDLKVKKIYERVQGTVELITIQNPTAQSTQIESVISVPIKDFIHHYPRALFNDIPRVGAHFYDIPGSGHTFTTYPGRGAV